MTITLTNQSTQEIQDKVIEIAAHKYAIDEKVLAGLIRAGSSVVALDDEGNLESMLVGALSLGEKTLVSTMHVIALHSTDVKKAKKFAAAFEGTAGKLLFSRQCMKYMGVPCDKDSDWYSAVVEEVECEEEDTTPAYPSALMQRLMYSDEFKVLKARIDGIATSAEKLSDTRDEYYPENIYKAIEELSDYGLVEYYPGVYSMSVLSEQYVRNLRRFSAEYEYKVNEEEISYAQIPEAVVRDNDPVLANKLESMFYDAVGNMAGLLYGIEPTLNVVQFAKYTPETTEKGNWHLDEDSEVSFVISLGDSHKGGGTVIKPYGSTREVKIPQLPAGHALMFNGKMYQHKGLPVTEGERDLLVFWSDTRGA